MKLGHIKNKTLIDDREPQPFAPTSGSNEVLQISIVHNTFLVTSII